MSQDHAAAFFRVLKPIKSIGAQPGDFLIARPGDIRPFVLYRVLSPLDLPVLAEAAAVEVIQPPHLPVPEPASSPRAQQSQLRVLRRSEEG